MAGMDTPIACTLTGESYRERAAWIAKLTSEGLLGFERRDLVLELHYTVAVAARVREMVRQEQECCAFLTFTLAEHPERATLTITAPERARQAADLIFEPFQPRTTVASRLTR